MPNEKTNLYEKVISNGYCIGCGACASLENSAFEVHIDEYGLLGAKDMLPTQSNCDSIDYTKVCPFSEKSLNEDQLAAKLFPGSTHKSGKLGNYEACYGGHVNEGSYRKNGTSGGIVKWIGVKLLEANEIDYFIQIYPAKTNGTTADNLFEYHIVSSIEEISRGSKAAYYPVSMQNVLRQIRKTPGRYAITTVPCYSKAIRLLQENDKVFAERVKFTIGIICGGMKSANYAKFIAMQYPIEPSNLLGIDFRKKDLTTPANHQSSEITFIKNATNTVEKTSKSNSEICGLDYGMGLFKPKACDYCDDVVAETADISVGDAWLPEFTKDAKGDSVVVIRNKNIAALVESAMKEGLVDFKKLSERDVIASQAAGFRHRREGLSVRIENKIKSDSWVPPKRNSVLNLNQRKVSEKRRKIYKLREKISTESHSVFHAALKNKDFEIFRSWLEPIILEYKTANKPTLLEKIIKKITRDRLGKR